MGILAGHLIKSLILMNLFDQMFIFRIKSSLSLKNLSSFDEFDNAHFLIHFLLLPYITDMPKP